ncbi:WXG100 family type VII secretion target [Streptomyces sp. YC504]|uniref:WXG100 family type VII secretion target n=1 Tax=Streptomyces mesophilus TaxID=1775132 RepID=A0A6G4XN53_9ACTN|nr:WXG100 family type VII secretion target [Streptomyces mesophilus]NGO78041.1 WXG100 family type VII secretion target [Streptomyces mesophilus]
MAGGRKLSKAELKSLVTEMDTQYDNLQVAVRNLNGTLDSLEGQWQGIGAGAFDAKQNQINGVINEIGRDLADMLHKIHQTSGDTTTTEEEIRARLDRIDPLAAQDSGRSSAFDRL